MPDNPVYTLGIDVGSTTVKAVVLDVDNNCLYANYVRHGSKVKETALQELTEIEQKLGNIKVKVSVQHCQRILRSAVRIGIICFSYHAVSVYVKR